MELSNLHRRAKLIALQNMFSYCIIPASLTTIIWTDFFLTLKKKMKIDHDHTIFLDSHKEHWPSQYSCTCVRTLQDIDGKSNMKNKKAVLSGSKDSSSWMAHCLGASNKWSTAQSCPERLYSLCLKAFKTQLDNA